MSEGQPSGPNGGKSNGGESSAVPHKPADIYVVLMFISIAATMIGIIFFILTLGSYEFELPSATLHLSSQLQHLSTAFADNLVS